MSIFQWSAAEDGPFKKMVSFWGGPMDGWSGHVDMRWPRTGIIDQNGAEHRYYLNTGDVWRWMEETFEERVYREAQIIRQTAEETGSFTLGLLKNWHARPPEA